MTSIAILALVVAAGPTDLTVDRADVDRGEVAAHKPLVQAFLLKNTGTTEVQLIGLTGTCGCLKHEFGATTLKAGETTTLTVSLSLLAQPAGPGNWNMTIRYQSGESKSELPIRVRALVRRDVTIEPAALVINGDGELTATVHVVDQRKAPAKVTSARVGLTGVSAEVRPQVERDGKTLTPIVVTVAASVSGGPHVGELVIDTGHPESRELRLPIRVVRPSAASVQFAPATPTVRFSGDQAVSGSLVQLRSNTGKELQIASANCDHPAVSCKWAIGSNGIATLRLTVDRSKTDGPGKAIVSVRLTAPVDETIQVPLSWTGP